MSDTTNSPESAQPSPEVNQPAVKPLPPEARQRALQEELTSLIDVVGVEPLVDLLLERAFQLGATDIHLDPREDGLALRLRLDGIMHDILHLKKAYAPQLVSRIKLISGMNITEKRHCQDGHISNSMLQHSRDVRVGSGPTVYGERLVLRLMSDNSNFQSFPDLGMEPEQAKAVEDATKISHGVILSVGPVGSGKSTTTYSLLAELNDPQRSVVTIEDPVERNISGANQIQVDTKINFGFVEALRGVLRQDPDVIMVGEIRDAETAHIAIRSGLMGTRVLSTLHATDTGSTLDMFKEFQIPRMFLADAIKCIIGQRLIRKVCPQSRESYRPDEATCEVLGISLDEARDLELVRGIPSDKNFHTGYMGRTGVFEVMSIDQDLRDLIVTGKPGRAVYDLSREKGMRTLEESAKAKVLAGITSMEEMLRITV